MGCLVIGMCSDGTLSDDVFSYGMFSDWDV